MSNPETSGMLESRAPMMSVVLATPDSYETIRKTVKHLRTQTVKHQMELVIVAPSVGSLNLDETEVKDFCRVRIVEIGQVSSIGSANAKGIRQASASIVALAEDHAFPAPGWAEALIAAHREAWAVVGPVIRHPNDPQSAVAWADCMICFGEYLAPGRSGLVERLPGNNCSYKRAFLLEYGSDLERMMETETLLHDDLQKKGHQLFVESSAQVAHFDFERPSSYFIVKYLSGRVFGAARAREWPLWYRLFYACGTPLIPFVLYWRRRTQLDLLRKHRKLPWGVMALFWCGLLVNMTGELIGCCFGAGQAVEKRVKFEFHRTPHLVKTKALKETEQ